MVNNAHTIVGASIGRHCGNCANLDDDQCSIRLILWDDLTHSWDQKDCPDWVTMFPQYINHRCDESCRSK